MTAAGDGHLTLSERFDRMEAHMTEIRASMQTIATRAATDQARLTEHERRITGLEAWQTWAQRLVIGGVIAAAIAALLVTP